MRRNSSTPSAQQQSASTSSSGREDRDKAYPASALSTSTSTSSISSSSKSPSDKRLQSSKDRPPLLSGKQKSAASTSRSSTRPSLTAKSKSNTTSDRWNRDSASEKETRSIASTMADLGEKIVRKANRKSSSGSVTHKNLARLRDTVGTMTSSAAKPPLESPLYSPRDTSDSSRSPSDSQGDDDTTPIETVSPSLVEAFDASPSPLTTSRTYGSTGSVGSTNTVRATQALGSLPVAHTTSDLRTPSYPFPYVPSRHTSHGTPLHQSFMALSPTSSNTPRLNARDRFLSFTTTPTTSRKPSMVPEATPSRKPSRDDVANPTPSLYDMVLQLNSEATLGAWWYSLSEIMQEHYGVYRMCLALPADPTDQNVPWAQKASFDAAGIRSLSVAALSVDQTSSGGSETQSNANTYTFASDPEQRPRRPPIESRHTYAGYEGSKTNLELQMEASGQRPHRLQASSRATSFAVAQEGSTPTTRIAGASPTVKRKISIGSRVASDAFNSSFKPDDDLTSLIHPTLRALDRETDALLDATGVSRVLERGKVVVLTRDYSITQGDTSKASSEKTSTRDQPPPQPANPIPSKAYEPSPATRHLKRTKSLGKKPMTSRRLSNTLQTRSQPSYEEFEQSPASPWSQSPAPSPAIQNDPDQNPFFANAGYLNEESFSPTPTKEDYTGFGPVEAIGIDQASTVLHLPLIHPSLSRHSHTTKGQWAARRNDSDDITPETTMPSPIAILSIMSGHVPYPLNLIQSLKDLSPHLATSFQTSFQATSVQERIHAALQRQNIMAEGLSSMPTESLPLGLGLESLLRFDIDDTSSSTLGSLASPSEYSGRSRYSPGNSIAGTPNIEHVSMNYLTSKAPVGNVTTPIIPPDIPADYFDAKKRLNLDRSRSGGVLTRAQLAAPSSMTRASSSEHRAMLRQLDTASGIESYPQERQSPSSKLRDEKSMKDGPRKRTGHRPHTPVDGTDATHAFLHSNGADFSASFQSLPVAAAMPRAAKGVHTRTASTSEASDMPPPPSEKLLRTMIDALPVQIFTAEPITGSVTWVNTKFFVYRMEQSTREVMENPWSTIHPDDLESFQQAWSNCLRTGLQFQHKVRIRRFDGNYRYYFARAVPLRDKMQNIVHWIGTLIDLHDQHVAETSAARQQETAASEAKYRALANSSPQIVFAATNSKGIIFCNSQWAAYSGQTEEQARGIGFIEHVHPEDIVKCRLPMFDAEGSPTNNVPVSMPSHPKRTKSGVSSAESSEDSTNSDITILGGIRATPSNIAMPQRQLSELATTGILKASKDAAGKASYSTEVRLRMTSGEYRWHLIRVLLAEPLIAKENEEETWYGTCTDINDHKELEQTLKETMDAKSRFLSNMSHEIRTPLNGIHGMATFLIDSNLTPEQLDQVNVIRASTEGLRDLINDILDLSKVEAGMISLATDWFHIRSVIEDVNDLTSSLAMNKDIELNYLVDEKVPFVVKGDRFRFRQVLVNVIGNAIKFTNEGEVLIRCAVAPEDENRSRDTTLLMFDVIDTGTGFNEKEAEKLFKRFSQIDGSTTRQHGGSGLGLFISHQLVELHGGDMTATSVPGKGSTFTFTMRFGLSPDSRSPALHLSVGSP